MRFVKSTLIIAACAVLSGCFHTADPLPGFANPFSFEHGTFTVEIIDEPTTSNTSGETLAWRGTYGGQWVAENEGFTGGMPLRNMRTAPMGSLRQIVHQNTNEIVTAEVLAPGYAQASLGDTGRDWRVVDGVSGRAIRGYILVQIPAADLGPYLHRLNPALAASTHALSGYVFGIGILETLPSQDKAQPSSPQRQQIRVVFPTCERVEADFRSDDRFLRASFRTTTIANSNVNAPRHYTNGNTQGVLARPGMQQGMPKPLTCAPNSVGALRDVFSEYLLRNRTFSQPHLLLRQ